MPETTSAFYRAVLERLAGCPHAERVLMSRATWDDLLARLADSHPLNLPTDSVIYQSVSTADRRNSVGMLHGLPVLIKDAVARGEFEVE